MAIETVNPATGAVIRNYEEMTPDKVKDLIDRAHGAFLEWRLRDFRYRAEKVQRAAEILLEKKEAFAVMITEEMGKTLVSAEGEVEKCALNCNHYAEHAEEYLKPRPVQTHMTKSYVAYQPLGVILAIMPWNFPFWQVFRFAAPALMAGNAVVLKHASNCTGSALTIEGIFREAGFPEDLFQTLVLSGSAVSMAMKHEQVVGVTLTGSEETGRAVAERAGKLLRKVVLELGGSDPYLILEDQDEESLDHAAEMCVAARMLVSGQVCISAKRLIAVDAIRESFTRKVLEKLRRYRCGDPMKQETGLGPLAREDLREQVHGQVRASVEQGARLLLGGEPLEGPGFFYPPTLLADVRKGMPAYDEEIFGPVAAVLPARDEAEAIRIAGDTRFGLGAAVFTRDVERGEAIAAHELSAGICTVNTPVFSDPRLPFGGIMASGHGRECSEEGIREFTNIKTVCVK
jgi:succinate-semialdehyde dehydrogenase/glutarate-semialdehyde dehydrogenase